MSRSTSGVLRALWTRYRFGASIRTSELFVTIMRAHRVQTWFYRHRGVPMAKRHCPPCGKERMFTIWSDGKYYCIPCLYRQAEARLPGPIPLEPSEEVMADFASAWRSYQAYIEAFEDPWTKPDDSGVRRLEAIAHVGPPAICTVDDCEPCNGPRPFMLREDGDAGCAYCLMRGRIVEFSIEISETEIAA